MSINYIRCSTSKRRLKHSNWIWSGMCIYCTIFTYKKFCTIVIGSISSIINIMIPIKCFWWFTLQKIRRFTFACPIESIISKYICTYHRWCHSNFRNINFYLIYFSRFRYTYIQIWLLWWLDYWQVKI